MVGRLNTLSFLLLSVLTGESLVAQTPMQPTDTMWYTVGGERHGISFFSHHRYSEVEYEAGTNLTFDRYHTAAVMYEWLAVSGCRSIFPCTTRTGAVTFRSAGR